ncbi:MAG: DUF4340 domain-containing protein [Saprospiraceae bacterium]|nr:DUF4340 domain-containing protein [Saprospiraceae bacterium]MBK9930532.1 DUF4340 domain-containing protein [Saprospiraceae bacterium]MBP8093743.1 DUF4340 domain-containing protein [Saprospiraceae bacterium]
MRFNRLLYFLTLVVIWSGCKVNTDQQETDFKISNPDEIRFIEIESKTFGHQVLSLRGSKWWLNDSVKIRQDAIDNILRVLPGLKVKFYPPRSAWENMIHAMQNEGVKLNFKNDHKQSIKSMYLGGMTNDERGTYAMLTGSTKPYVLHLPGFEGSLASRFMMSENQWRDRLILEFDPKQVQSLKMEYPAEEQSGFAIVRDPSGAWSLKDHQGKMIKSSETIMMSYLEIISSIGAESIENDFIYRDTVLQETPHAILTLQMDGDDAQRRIRFYANRLEGAPDPERMFVYDDHDFYLAQIRILHKLFRPVDHFTAK